MVLHRSKTASPITDSSDPVSNRAGSSIPSILTVTSGAGEGVKGWIRNTDGNSSRSSGMHSPCYEVALVADCSFSGFDDVGLRRFPEHAWGLSTRHDFQEVGVAPSPEMAGIATLEAARLASRLTLLEGCDPFPSVSFPDRINVASSFPNAVAALPEDHRWLPNALPSDNHSDHPEVQVNRDRLHPDRVHRRVYCAALG